MINLLFVLLTLPAFAQEAQIFIDVGQGQVKKSLLALPPPVGMKDTDVFHKTVISDLTASGLFDFIKPEAYLEDPQSVGLKPAPGDPSGFKFENWKTIGAEFIFRGKLAGDKLEAHVYHVPTARLVIGKTYENAGSGSRRLAHVFANELIQALTGKYGIFLTKIAASRQDAGSWIKEIYVMDWDGAAAKRITNDETINSSPAWSNKGDRIAYRSFANHPKNKTRNPDIFIHDLATSKNRLVSHRKGLNSGAVFTPGDDGLILTMSFEGNSDIYRLPFDGTGPKALTRGPIGAMNVEPAVSPDGMRLAFASDRTGNTHIFLSSIDGSGPKKLTNAGKLNSSPSWSPDGKTIAFAADASGHFDIFTIRTDGSNLKRLTQATKSNGRAANHENPSWSPDGRHILFASDRTGNMQLYMITADGSHEHRITNDRYNWNTPKWSPYLE